MERLLFICLLFVAASFSVTIYIGGDFEGSVGVLEEKGWTPLNGGLYGGVINNQSSVNGMVQCGDSLWIVGDFLKGQNSTAFIYPIVTMTNTDFVEPSQNFPKEWKTKGAIVQNIVCNEADSIVYIAGLIRNSSNQFGVGKIAFKEETPTWESVGNPFNGGFTQLLLADGDLYASGMFTSVGNLTTPYFAKLNGTNWIGVGNWSLDSPFPASVGYNNGSFYFTYSNDPVIRVLNKETEKWEDPLPPLINNDIPSSIAIYDPFIVVGVKSPKNSTEFIQIFSKGNWRLFGPNNNYWTTSNIVSLLQVDLDDGLLYAAVGGNCSKNEKNVLTKSLTRLTLVGEPWDILGNQPQVSSSSVLGITSLVAWKESTTDEDSGVSLLGLVFILLSSLGAIILVSICMILILRKRHGAFYHHYEKVPDSIH